MEIVNSLPKKLSILDDIENINNRLGDTNISDIGDGTVTGALDLVKNSINLNSQNKASFDTVEGGTTIGLSSGYYKVITVSNNTDTEGFQIAVGYYGGNAIGKCYYRSWVNGGAYEEWEGCATKNDIDTVDTKILSNMPTAEYGSGYNIFSVVDDLFVDTARKSASFCYLSAIEGAPNADNGTVTAYSLDIDWITLICVTRFNKVFTANKRGGTWSGWEELARKSDLDSLTHRQIAVGNFSVQAEGSYSVGVAVVTHGGNFGNTAYTAIVQQYTESDKNYLVNPPCIILGTKPIDGNSMYVYAVNADGTAYTSSVWLSLVFVNRPLG